MLDLRFDVMFTVAQLSTSIHRVAKALPFDCTCHAVTRAKSVSCSDSVGDIGCQHSTRSDLKAVPGPCHPSSATIRSWIADTCSAQDVVCSKTISNDSVYTHDSCQPVGQHAFVQDDSANKEVHPCVLPDASVVFSVGMRSLQDGKGFAWKSIS